MRVGIQHGAGGVFHSAYAVSRYKVNDFLRTIRQMEIRSSVSKGVSLQGLQHYPRLRRAQINKLSTLRNGHPLHGLVFENILWGIGFNLEPA